MRIINWYKNLPFGLQLIISFILQLFYWIGAWLLLDAYVFESNDKKTLTELFFKAAWMAVCMTVFFNWKQLRLLRKKKNDR